MTHKHSWAIAACIGGDMLEYLCSCGKTETRRMTGAERAWCDKWNFLSCSLLEKPIKGHDIHRVWYKVSGLLKRYKDWSGYELMQLMEKVALKYPKHVILQSSDDSYYSGSLICYILHYDEYAWHGVTVLNLPQNSDEDNLMFLYPGHLESKIKILTHIQEIQTKIQRSEEHTSELQSHSFISYAVFCLKKKTKNLATIFF